MDGEEGEDARGKPSLTEEGEGDGCGNADNKQDGGEGESLRGMLSSASVDWMALTISVMSPIWASRLERRSCMAFSRSKEMKAIRAAQKMCCCILHWRQSLGHGRAVGVCCVFVCSAISCYCLKKLMI